MRAASPSLGAVTLVCPPVPVSTPCCFSGDVGAGVSAPASLSSSAALAIPSFPFRGLPCLLNVYKLRNPFRSRRGKPGPAGGSPAPRPPQPRRAPAWSQSVSISPRNVLQFSGERPVTYFVTLFLFFCMSRTCSELAILQLCVAIFRYFLFIQLCL